MPDWRYNVLSTSEAYINTDGVALDPLAASYPRRADRTRPQHTCPYTTIFLGARSHHSPFRQTPQQTDSIDPYADVYSVDRSSNLTDTSSFARYEDCRPQLDDDDLPQIIDQEESDLQKVPYNSSNVFFVSAKSESPHENVIQNNNVFLVEGSDSDALSSCTCDSFERCEFDCRDFEPFSDTCCCDPLSDGVCSRSPKNVESPENFCDRVVEEDCVSARSDMDGLDLTLFEPAQVNECDLDENTPSVSSSLCGILHALPESTDVATSAVAGAATGVPLSWEPFYCVLQQDRRILTAYTSEELAVANNNGEYTTRSLPRVRLDSGTQVNSAGVRLRCWAAPPSITEEEVEDEIEEDAVSLRAMPAQDGNLNDDQVLQDLGNGNFSDIEDFDDDDDDFQLSIFEDLASEPEPAAALEVQLDPDPITATPTPSGTAPRSRSSRPPPKKRLWKQVPFEDLSHDYSPLPASSVRTPMEYFSDYFDRDFYEEVARCTNMYHLRKTGQELKITSTEIATVFSIHIIIGCIPYPRIPMYWRGGLKLELISQQMSRDKFLLIRNALHVVDIDEPRPNDRNNPLWKVQPMIDRVKAACYRLERAPGFYSIDEQMIPFTGRCILRQVVRNKPRPVGLKNFVLTTSEGLMLDFEIYRGAKTMFGDTGLGLGPSVILHLVKSVPPGSCVYHDRYFTTVGLIEEMHKRNIHSTGTIMLNRMPDRAAIKFKTDSRMNRGECQQYVAEPTVIVKWKDNKSVLMASNCTGASSTSMVKRWDKRSKMYIDVSVPKVIKRYNQHMGGVDVLDQQMEYYRTFIKTKKWTLKVLIHFLDLAIVNAWRLYRNDCLANKLSRRQILPLLDFRLNIADRLSSMPARKRPQENIANESLVKIEPPLPKRQYRPVNRLSKAKRYDGYKHFPVFDEIKAPRMCRNDNCTSRTKVRCQKCDMYLCIARGKECFKSYHTKSS